MAKYRLRKVTLFLFRDRSLTGKAYDTFLLECGHEVTVPNADFSINRRRCYACCEQLIEDDKINNILDRLEATLTSNDA